MAARSPRNQVHFLSLPTAIFCVQCELISQNTTTACLACGSKAVLSVSRLLGGSLRSQPLARLIQDDELNRMVRDLLSTVPEMEYAPPYSESDEAIEWQNAPAFSLASNARGIRESKIELEPMIGAITERAQALTGATGAAIALR